MSGFKRRHDHSMEKLSISLASDDLGSMIDALLADVNDEFTALAALGGNQRSLERASARLTLLTVMSDHYAAMADNAADDRFNASIASAMPGREINNA